MGNTETIREALDILDARLSTPNSAAINRGLRLALRYALEDHEDEPCPAADGECIAERLARQIVAGEL
jgi:hypothetical protein